MAGRPKRRARLLAEGKTLPLEGAPRTSARHRARYLRPGEAPGAGRNHEIIQGHPAEAPAAAHGRGSPFCSTASVSAAAIAYHTSEALARRHLRQLPAALRPFQVVRIDVTEHVDGGFLETVIATWCEGGRLKTFIGLEGS